jgi:hypothetical protein
VAPSTLYFSAGTKRRNSGLICDTLPVTFRSRQISACGNVYFSAVTERGNSGLTRHFSRAVSMPTKISLSKCYRYKTKVSKSDLVFFIAALLPEHVCVDMIRSYVGWDVKSTCLYTIWTRKVCRLPWVTRCCKHAVSSSVALCCTWSIVT